jgi:hypothetical protein
MGSHHSAVPAAFLTRHYACGPASHAAVCTVFVLAVHHWFIYLQAALTSGLCRTHEYHLSCNARRVRRAP